MPPGIDDLPHELLLALFEWLDPRSLVEASAVCTKWFRLARDGLIWKRLCERKWKTKQLVFEPRDPLVWRKIFFFQRFCRKTTILASPIEASSTDFPDQGIMNTLVNDGLHYWSSEGSADVDSSEYLQYQLAHPICLVESLEIEFYRAEWQVGHPVYCPKELQVSFYLGKNLQETISFGKVSTTSLPQTFRLPHPVVANRIMLHLDGRTCVQPGDELYYTVVQFVDVSGYLLPGFKDEDICEAQVNHASKFITAPDLMASFFPVDNFDNSLRYYVSCPRLRKANFYGNFFMMLNQQ